MGQPSWAPQPLSTVMLAVARPGGRVVLISANGLRWHTDQEHPYLKVPTPHMTDLDITLSELCLITSPGISST